MIANQNQIRNDEPGEARFAAEGQRGRGGRDGICSLLAVVLQVGGKMKAPVEAV